MTVYPSISSYDFAVSNLNKFIHAPQIMGGSPILTPQKRIFSYTGGFAVVYPVKANEKKLALRCWISAPPRNVKERYAIAKQYFQSNQTSYFVDFDYIDKGITVKGNTYPIVLMEWIEGKVLSQFIDENINNSAVISTVASRFLEMVKELHSKKISHGNLADNNIIITSNSSFFDLKLVDYDCVYTPTMQDLKSQDGLIGVPAYQHPKRHPKSDEKADYFSELVIYLSLLAYSERPNLWEKGQENRLLFTEGDFLNPSKSNTFKTLETLSPKVKHLSSKLIEFCQEIDTNRLLPLEQVISSNSMERLGENNTVANNMQVTNPLFGDYSVIVVDNSSEVTLLTSENQKLTPAFLSQIVSPYIVAIADIQKVIDEIRNNPKTEVVVRSITQNSPISVSLDGASEAIKTVQDNVVRWRRENAKILAQQQISENEVAIEVLKAETLERRANAAKSRAEAEKISVEADKQRQETEKIRLENEKTRIEIERAKVQLALDILDRIDPNIPATEKISHVVKLLSPLGVVAFSKVELSVGE